MLSHNAKRNVTLAGQLTVISVKKEGFVCHAIPHVWVVRMTALSEIT